MCLENTLSDNHRILVPPKLKGKFTFITLEADYNTIQTIAELEYDGKQLKFAMINWWPVR